MSTISVLAFPSESTTPTTRDSFDTETTFKSHDWAFQVESPKQRFINIRKPYNIIYTRQNTEPVPIVLCPRQPILKIHIATAKHPNLLGNISKALAEVPANTKPEEWLDAALLSLQTKFIVQRFDIPKFHQFILDSLSKMPSASFRRMSSGTTELDYLSLMCNKSEVKKMLAPLHADGQAAATTAADSTPAAQAPPAGAAITSHCKCHYFYVSRPVTDCTRKLLEKKKLYILPTHRPVIPRHKHTEYCKRPP